MNHFTCHNCSASFDGDDFTTNCPSCGSNQIFISEESGDKQAINIRLSAAIVLGLLLVSGISFWLYNYYNNAPVVISIDGADEVIGHSLLIDQVEENVYQLKILDEDNRIIPESSVLRLRNHSRNSDMFHDRSTGLFYPCLEDLARNSTLEVTYNYDGQRKSISTTHDIVFQEGVEPHRSAVCRFRISPSDIRIKDIDLKKCTFRVTIREKLIPGKQSVNLLYSAMGKNGPYRESNIFDIKPVRSNNCDYNVWIINGSDTVPYFRNGDRIPNCTQNKEEISSMIPKIKKAAEQFARNPDDGLAFSKALNKLDPPNIVYYLDDLEASRSLLINKMENMYYDEGAEFKVDRVEKKDNQIHIRIAKVK